MDIIGLFHEPLINLVVGLFGGGFILLLYNYLKVGAWIKSGGRILGNRIGLMIHDYSIKNIKDTKLKEKAINDLDLAGDHFDEGFDLGIRGTKLT